MNFLQTNLIPEYTNVHNGLLLTFGLAFLVLLSFHFARARRVVSIGLNLASAWYKALGVKFGKTRAKATIGFLVIVGIGFIFTFSTTKALQEIGHFLLAAVTVHFLFEFVVNKSHAEELTVHVIGEKLSGILRIQSFYIPKNNSDQPDEQYKKLIRTAIQTSVRLDIAARHSIGTFQHFKPEFFYRRNQKLPTKILFLKEASDSEKHLLEEIKKFGDAKALAVFNAGVKRLKLEFESLLVNDLGVNPEWHEKTLAYEFMRSDTYIWISPYLNTCRDRRPPWICIPESSELFAFYDDEIDLFFKQQEVKSK